MLENKLSVLTGGDPKTYQSNQQLHEKISNRQNLTPEDIKKIKDYSNNAWLAFASMTGGTSAGGAKGLEGIKKAQDNVDSLIEEARKYKSAEEFVKGQGTPIYHGTNVKNAEMIKNNPRLLSVEEQQQFPTTVVGDTQIGISSSKEKSIAEYFASLQPTNRGEVVDLVLPNNANIYTLPDGVDSIDSLGLKELQRIKNLGYDAIEDVSNIGGESEIRVITPEILKTKSQLTDIWNKANQLTSTVMKPQEYQFVREPIFEREPISISKGDLTPKEIATSKLTDIKRKMLIFENEGRYPPTNMKDKRVWDRLVNESYRILSNLKD
jgi:hypothetical protein